MQVHRFCSSAIDKSTKAWCSENLSLSQQQLMHYRHCLGISHNSHLEALCIGNLGSTFHLWAMKHPASRSVPSEVSCVPALRHSKPPTAQICCGASVAQ